MQKSNDGRSRINCPKIDQIKALMLGNLTGDAFDRLERHVENCPKCQSQMSKIGDIEDPEFLKLKRLFGLHSKTTSEKFRSLLANETFEQTPILGDFRILKVLGRGGMGVVYEAVQISLGRSVALKVLPQGRTLDPRLLARFETEARAAAFLDHPNIIPVFAIGSDQGVHYYAMHLVDGLDLAHVIPQVFSKTFEVDHDIATKPRNQTGQSNGSNVDFLIEDSNLETNQGLANILHSLDTEIPSDSTSGALSNKQAYIHWVAKIGIQVAEALDTAHEQGVLHRDIKPSNLMLDKSGKLWVTDFGLARIESGLSMTETGDLIGTLRYSSPEQALGKRGLVDHRSDVYSLGATLYEMLTGVPLFGDAEQEELLTKIANDDPSPPRKINRSVPSDLETIVLKAISKETVARYETAQEFADDLRRFVEHKPIHAQRPSLKNRIVKWTMRNKPWAAAILTAVVAMLSLIGGLVAHAATLSDYNEKLNAGNQKLESTNSQLSEALGTINQQQKNVARLLYAADLQLADKAWHDRDPRQVISILDRHLPSDQETDLRGPEWHYLKQQAAGFEKVLAQYDQAAYTLAFSSDGRWLATAGEESVVRVYDTTTLAETLSLNTEQGEINGICFSPDGVTVATTGDNGTIQLWEWRKKQLKLEIAALDDEVYEVLFTPDGQRLISTGIDPKICVWNALSGELLGRLEGHTDTAGAIDISPDGQLLASASSDWTLRLWDLNSLRQIRVLHKENLSKLVCVKFSNDGRWLASGGRGRRVTVHEVKSGRLLFTGEHHDGVQSVAFSPDDRQLASSDRGGSIYTWTLPDNGDSWELEPFMVLAAHKGRGYRLRYMPHGRHLASAGSDGAIKWLTPIVRLAWQRISGDGHYGMDMAFTDDGRSLLTCQSAAIYWNDFENLRTDRIFTRSTVAFNSIAISPKSKELVVGDFDGRLRVYDLNTGREVRQRIFKPGGIISMLGYSLDGRYLVFEVLGIIHVLDAMSLETLQFAKDIQGAHHAFSRDSSTIIVEHNDDIHFWDLASLKRTKTISGAHRNGIGYLALNPDGHLLASGGGDRLVKIWDTHTGRHLFTLAGHLDKVESLAFSPGGRTLLSGDRSGNILAWQVATGRKLVEFDQFVSGIRSILFSPDGESIVCRLFNAQIYVLRLKGPFPVREEIPLNTMTPDEPSHQPMTVVRDVKLLQNINIGQQTVLLKRLSMTRSRQPIETCRVRLLRNGKLEYSERDKRSHFDWSQWEQINQSREGFAGELKEGVDFDICGHAETETERNNRIWLCVVTRDGKVWISGTSLGALSWHPFEELWRPSAKDDQAVRVRCEEIDQGRQVAVTLTTRDGRKFHSRRDPITGWSKSEQILDEVYPLDYTREFAENQLQALSSTVKINNSGEVLGTTELAAACADDSDLTIGFVGWVRLVIVDKQGKFVFLGTQQSQRLPDALSGRTTQKISFNWKDRVPLKRLNEPNGIIILHGIGPIESEEVHERIRMLFEAGEVDWLPSENSFNVD